MTQTLTEDDLYRTSSQYRFWSFSPETLAALRRKTHELAIERAKQYGVNANGATNSQENALNGGDGSEGYGCLTEQEEVRLVQRYCDQIRTTSDKLSWPINVKATAVQYLRRFYLSNSVLTYPPKEIYKTVLFLACKTEATHMTLSEYARRISTEPEVVLAPEYKVMQALRFTLDVRQPYRGLKGVTIELVNLAAGLDAGGGEAQEAFLALEAPKEGDRTRWKPSASGNATQKAAESRIDDAYLATKVVLDGAGLLTDVYFLYTPSQILLAALSLADRPLFDVYLGAKLGTMSELRPKILATIQACADMLAAFSPDQIMSKDERSDLEDKLERCRDPSTRDLVKAHAAMKLGSADDDEKAERKKQERAKAAKEGEDLFGPSLGPTNGAKG